MSKNDGQKNDSNNNNNNAKMALRCHGEYRKWRYEVVICKNRNYSVFDAIGEKQNVTKNGFPNFLRNPLPGVASGLMLLFVMFVTMFVCSAVMFVLLITLL